MASQVSLKSLTTTVLLTLTTSIISVYSTPPSQAAIASTVSTSNTDSNTHLAQVNPANLEALMDQGIAALDADNYTEALNYFEQAIALNPAHAPAYTGQGLAFYYLDQLLGITKVFF